MKTRRHLFLLSFAVSGLIAAEVCGQTASDPDSVTQAAHGKMDSLEQTLRGTLFSPAEQKSWRDCERNKREFLDRGRKADPAFSTVDSSLRSAKLGAASPDDPNVEKLMERKYRLEQKLEDAYRAQPEGKRCSDIADQRQSKLEAALKGNADYQKWKRLAEPPQATPAPL